MTAHARSIVFLAKNSTWNLIAFATSLLANLILLPYVVKLIGIRQFGICGLLISISTPLSLIGSILGQTVCQAVARFRAQSNERAVRAACATVWALGLICIPAGALLLAWLVSAVAVRMPEAGRTSGSLLLVSIPLVVAWASQQLSLIVQSIHVACMAYRRIAAINILGAAFNLISTFILVTQFRTVAGYLGAIAVAQAFAALAWLGSAALGYRWCLVRPRLAQEMRSSIYEFSGWFTVSQLVAGCAAQADRYVLGAVRNTAAIGYLNLAQRIEEAAYSVMVKAADSLFPYFSAQSGHGRVNARFYFTVSWLVNLTAAAAIAPLIPLAPSLISLWVNAETASYSSLVLRTLAVAGILGCASHVFKQYLLGTAKARQFAYLNLASAFTASVAAIILLPRYGLRAAGVGALIAMAVQLGIVVALIWRYFRPVGTIRRILSAIFVPLTVAIGGACGIARYDFPTLSTWPKLVGGYLLISASMTLAIFALNSLLAEGRQLLGDLRGSLKLVRAELARRRTVTTVHESDVVRREQGPMQGVDISPPV